MSYEDDNRPTLKVGKMQASNTHIAGEMFVAAELAKRGYNVSLTMGNAKAVDIFAEINGYAVCVQVKALSRSKNVGWPLPLDRRKVVANVVYVCVVLNEIGQQPTYYILRPEDVLSYGKWYETRAILEISKVKKNGHLDAWSTISAEISRRAKSGPLSFPIPASSANGLSDKATAD